MREEMDNLWSNEELLGWYKREILVCNHSLIHWSFKCLFRLSKMVIIPRKLIKFIKLSPCVAHIFVKSHKRKWRNKVKRSGRSISKPSETRPGAMTSIDHMVSSQPVIIPQVIGYLIHSRFWAANIFLGHYSDYFYAHLMIRTSSKETLQAK